MTKWGFSLAVAVLALCFCVGWVEWHCVRQQRLEREWELWREAHPADDDYPMWVDVWRPADTFLTSKYDDVFRYIGSQTGWDWRFISAITRAESEYDPMARSRRGAIGLMQVMPRVAARHGVSVGDAFDPIVNVRLGVAHLDEIAAVLRFPAAISERDRLSIILASYNSGLGHVLDARRLALAEGENYNSWSVVARFLRLKAHEEYHGQSSVRAGRFGGADETIAFVHRVMRYYNENLEYE